MEEYVGRRHRPGRAHGDIDVTIAREHWPAVHAASRPRMRVWIARDGCLHDTADTPVRDDVDTLWARPLTGGPWQVQVHLEEVSAGTWTYRRDRRVWRPVGEASWWSGRCWCIVPAVQLLWKAAAPRQIDEHDYAMTVPSLPAAERTWLRRGLHQAHPHSP